jgi:predicted nuclease of restriction endonuclease-like (RecB) superfamily
MSESTSPSHLRGISPARRPSPGEPVTSSDLVERVSSLIDQARESIASYANATLTMTYWQVGSMIDAEVLNEERAEYGAQILATLSRELVERFGRGFEEANLRRMVKFARQFPDAEIPATLSRKLSWSHFVTLMPLRSPEARMFYAKQAIAGRLSVRDLKHAIQRKAYERREIANAQIEPGSMVPADTFSDPYLLDFLGLHDQFLEADLEAAILRDLEAFLLEVGTGFTFVERQKRMIIDDIDFHLDLLLYHRPLRRLVAVELKIGKFDARHEGQMKLYLRWLNRYERQEGEETPIGLILCTEASREQVELLEMHKDGIVVAEYWTALPPKKELEERLRLMLQSARERLARRELPSATDNDR